MRQVTQDAFGGPEVLRVVDVERPEPGPTEVLVRVRAAGINPVDWKTRAFETFLGEPPYTIGWDVAGVVEGAGRGATGVGIGDEVLGMPWFPRPARGYGEYVTAPSRQFVRKPAGMSFEEAAALPLAGLTAWQALVDVANVRSGQRVLVDAAAGGVGHLAAQIAKARGAYVLGTASKGKHEFLRSIGVDEPVDYRDERAEVSDVDVLVALAGPESGRRWLRGMRRGGVVLAIGGDAPAEEAEKLGVRIVPVLVEPDRIGLNGLIALYEEGKLRVHVEQAFPLEDVAKAHEVGEAGRVIGKLVLTL